MYDIHHRIGIDAPLTDVHASLTTIDGLATWWTTDTTGDPVEGGKIAFTFGAPERRVEVEVVQASAERVVWRCTFGPDEWVDTTFEFALAQHGDETVVQFTQAGWREVVAFTGHCTTKWGAFLQSLKAQVERGEGRPFPDDLHISSWD